MTAIVDTFRKLKHARDTQDPECRESPSRHAVARTIRAKSEQLLCGGAYLSLIC
jgi:hypothetical protein